jgi:hypothetical protein
MTFCRGSILTIGLLTALGVFTAYTPVAIAEDEPKVERKEGEPAGPPKGPPLERKDAPNAKGPRTVPLPEGGLRGGPQNGPEGERFRPGRPVANPNPGDGLRRERQEPNPNDPEGRPEGNRRPAAFGGGGAGFNPRGRGPGDFGQMKEDDPEMFELMQADMKLDQQTREQAEEYRRAKPSEREAIKTKLAKLVEEHYDVRQKRRELELRRLEEQLTRLRDSVKKRVDEKEVMIKQRVSQLVGNPDDGF